MTDFRDAFDAAFPDYNVPGVPASGVAKPSKPLIRRIGQDLNAKFDEIEAGQSAGQVVAGTWSELSGYPTDDREVGDYGKVVGTDAGTHTDPVVGGTVDNRGVYRWSASPAGWKRIADLDADDADASADRAEEARDEAIAAAASFRAPVGMLTDNMVVQYVFDEGEGDTVQNILDPGTLDLDLTAATDPNVEWTRTGVRLTAGLIRTDEAIPGVRTIATLYRVPYGQSTGMIISAGNPAGGYLTQGLFGGGVQPGFTYHIGCGQGVAPVPHDDNGQGAWRTNRGGWVLVFMEFPAAYETVIGWGGQANHASNLRSAELDVAWAGAWSTTLDDDDREQVFKAVRRLAVKRGIYLHWEDCPEVVDAVRFLGQSGVTGFSLVSEITDADTRSRTQPCDSVLVSHMYSAGGEWLMTERFQFKYNHRAQGSIGEKQSKMGPMPGAAFAHEDNHTFRQRRLLICQSAQDSTTITINPSHYGEDKTWNVATAKTGGMLWASMRHWWTIEQHLLSQGIGPRLVACWYFQGEEDGQSFSTPETWEDDIQDLWDAEKLYMGAPDYQMKLIKTGPLGRAPYGTSNGLIEAKIEVVREAQEDFAGANADVELIDCDDLPLDAFEHWNGQGSLEMGARLYAATDLT